MATEPLGGFDETPESVIPSCCEHARSAGFGWRSGCARIFRNGRIERDGLPGRASCDSESDEEQALDGQVPWRVGRFTGVRQPGRVNVVESALVCRRAARLSGAWPSRRSEDHWKAFGRHRSPTSGTHATGRCRGFPRQRRLGRGAHVPDRGMLERHRPSRANDAYISLARDESALATRQAARPVLGRAPATGERAL